MINEISMPIHEGRELPEVTFRQIDLPDLVNWDVGKKCYLVIKTEMTDKGKVIDDKLEGRFKILSVKLLDEKLAAKYSQQEYEEHRVKFLNYGRKS